MAKVCINPPTPQQQAQVVDQVAERLPSDIPRSLARSIAGGFVGNVIDNQLDPYDEGGMPIFTALGLLAGSRTGIRATSFAGSKIRAGVDAVVPAEYKRFADADGLARKQQEMDAWGAKILATDTANVNGFTRAINGVRNSLASGREGVDGFFQSGWVRSQFSTLRAIAKNAPIAHKMSQFFVDLPNQIKIMKGDMQQAYNARFGTDAFEQYVPTKGVPMAREIMKSIADQVGIDQNTLTDDKVRSELMEAIMRIRDTDLGGDVVRRKGVDQAYMDNPWKRAFDDALIQDADFRAFSDNIKDFFLRAENEIKQNLVRSMDEAIDEIAVIVKGPDFKTPHKTLYRESLHDLLKDFRASKMSWKQYLESSSKDQNNLATEILTSLNQESSDSRVSILFNRVRELQTKVNSQDSFSGAYIPHTEDHRKMRVLKQRMLERGQLRPDGAATDLRPGDEGYLPTFDEYVERKTYQVNYGNDRRLYAEDGQMADMNLKTYRSSSEAKSDFNRLLTQKRANGEISEQQYATAVRMRDSFLRTGRKADKDGNMSDFHYLEAPENFEFNLFDTNNRAAFKVFSGQYRLKGFDVKKSARIDYQRKVDMPYEFRQTDIYSVMNGYANDVAPRLHSMKNGIYDIADFRSKWIGTLRNQLGNSPAAQHAEEVAERIQSIYNASMRVSSFDTLEKMNSYEKMARVSNLWRNVMATAYQYGIGFYNLFEHAVQTPTLTSWRSYANTMGLFATNRKAANAMADTLLDFKVIDLQMKTNNGNLDYIEDIAGKTWAENALEKTAQGVSNFSLSKYLGRGIGVDVEKAGLLRIAFDGFMGGNLMSTAINTQASLYEVRKLTEVYQALKQIPEGQPQQVRMHGHRYNIGTVERKLADLGIPPEELNGFMDARTQSFLKDFMENIEAGRKLTPEEIHDNRDAIRYLQTIMNHTTENYQATNQFMRPEKSLTPGGRLAYQYSTYSYNQVFQNYQRRIKFPIEDWSAKLPENLRSRMSIGKMLYHYNTGDMEALRKIPGMTDELIQTLPADAYNHYAKFFGAAVGISVLGHMSVDTFRDVVANPWKDEDERWSRLNRRTIVNPLAPQSEQFTFAEMRDDFQGSDVFALASYFAAMTIDTGLTGRLDAFYSSYGKQSLLDLTPVTRAANDAYRDMQRVATGGVDEFSTSLTNVAIRNSLRYLPVVGSSPFSEVRAIAQSKLLDDPRAATVRIDGAPMLPQTILPNR